MLNRIKIALFWSGGKDSAMALHRLMQSPERYELHCLVTTINADFGRISMHGIREVLLDKQAQSIGLPLQKMYVPQACNNADYETALQRILSQLKEEGITHIAYGDIFLEDLRHYREQLLAQVGLEGIFPLWKESTQTLSQQFIEQGFQTYLCCVKDELGKEFAGAEYNEALLKSFPADCDPCGENGEFHTFCYDGPIFSTPIPIQQGESIYRSYAEGKGFWFTDFC